MNYEDKLRKFPFDDDSDDSSSGGEKQKTSSRKPDESEDEASVKSSSSFKPEINKASINELQNKRNQKSEARVTFKEQNASEVWSEEEPTLSEKTSPRISHKETTKNADKGASSTKTKPTIKNKTQVSAKPQGLDKEEKSSSKKKKRIKTKEDDDESLLRSFVEFDSSSNDSESEDDKNDSKQVARKVISYNSQGLPPQDSSLRTRFRDTEDDTDDIELSSKRGESKGDYFYESDEDTRYGPTKVFSFTSGLRSRMTFHRKRIVQYNQKYSGFGNLLSPFVRIVDDSVQNHTGPVKYFCLMCGAGPNRLLLKETVDHLKSKCPRTQVQESESMDVDNALTILAEHYDQYVDPANRRLRLQQDAVKLAEIKARRSNLLNRTADLITESKMEKSVKNFQAIHSLLRKVMTLKTQMGLRGKDVEVISAASFAKRMRKYEEAEDERC